MTRTVADAAIMLGALEGAARTNDEATGNVLRRRDATTAASSIPTACAVPASAFHARSSTIG